MLAREHIGQSEEPVTEQIVDFRLVMNTAKQPIWISGRVYRQILIEAVHGKLFDRVPVLVAPGVQCEFVRNYLHTSAPELLAAR